MSIVKFNGEDIIIKDGELFFVGIECLAEIFQQSHPENIQLFMDLSQDEKKEICRGYEADAVHYHGADVCKTYKTALEQEYEKLNEILQAFPFKLIRSEGVLRLTVNDENVVYSNDLYDVLQKNGLVTESYDDVEFLDGDYYEFVKKDEDEKWEQIIRIDLDRELEEVENFRRTDDLER